MQTRQLGNTGIEVTCLGLGGEGVLRTFGRDREAADLINRAIDLGIGYFESARAYAGSEGYYGLALGQRRAEIFLASKSHARDRKGARAHLEETLASMDTDHLDLWQVHDVRTGDDVETIFGPGGAMETFEEARREGLARFIGVTAHHDPAILQRCIDLFDFDTVLVPVNPAEPARASFLEGLAPRAVEKGLGIVGMKAYIRGLGARVPSITTMEPLLRFALSHPVSTVVVGCDDVAQLEQNVRFAERFSPMSEEERRRLVRSFAPFAHELLYYKP
jgi:aryl-alcohol dehydrogenase-like predicted oxidoreductase